jgi:hypothetical protein
VGCALPCAAESSLHFSRLDCRCSVYMLARFFALVYACSCSRQTTAAHMLAQNLYPAACWHKPCTLQRAGTNNVLRGIQALCGNMWPDK